MGIKGSATIELTNADGSKEIYKHDNMITNAVNDLCTSQRGEMATILKMVNNGDSYAQALFGGLLLFDETLNDDAADYFLPTVKCTGYASQDAYAGLDTCRGSFNQTEGGIQEDGSYKFVWDFATSQANGTIKSLALVPNMMGQIGLTSSKASSEVKDFYMKRTSVEPFNTQGHMLSNDFTVDGDVASALFVVAVIDDIAYALSNNNTGFRGSSVSSSKSITNNGGKLRLHRFKLGASSIALSDKVGMASFIDYTDVQLPTEFISTLSTATYSTIVMCSYDNNSKKLIVGPCSMNSDIQINGAIKYCEIDLSNNYAVSVKTFTNNTAGTIGSSGYYPGVYKYRYMILGDYVLTASKIDSSTMKLYVTEKANNTNVKEVKNNDGTAYTFSSYNYLSPVFWSDKIAIIAVRSSAQSIAYGYIAIDLQTATMRDTNIREMTYSGALDIGNESIFIKTDGYLAYEPVVNPFILCTKNNLDNPVTKTASQTMKITYTLSVADAAESEV